MSHGCDRYGSRFYFYFFYIPTCLLNKVSVMRICFIRYWFPSNRKVFHYKLLIIWMGCMCVCMIQVFACFACLLFAIAYSECRGNFFFFFWKFSISNRLGLQMGWKCLLAVISADRTSIDATSCVCVHTKLVNMVCIRSGQQFPKYQYIFPQFEEFDANSFSPSIQKRLFSHLWKYFWWNSIDLLASCMFCLLFY